MLLYQRVGLARLLFGGFVSALHGRVAFPSRWHARTQLVLVIHWCSQLARYQPYPVRAVATRGIDCSSGVTAGSVLQLPRLL